MKLLARLLPGLATTASCSLGTHNRILGLTYHREVKGLFAVDLILKSDLAIDLHTVTLPAQ